MGGPQKEEEQTTHGEPAHPIRCPECGSSKTWRDGLRPLGDGRRIQRYICRFCGYRFSESIKNGGDKRPSLNPPCNPGAPSVEMQEEPNGEEHQEPDLNIQVNFRGLQAIQQAGRDYIYPPLPSIRRRVCAGEGPAKNSAAAMSARQGEDMATAEPEPRNRAVGDISANKGKEVEGKIIEFLWWMKRQGYKETTIRGKGNRLTRLMRLGADLLDPESVKEVIARQGWSDSGKETTAYAYDLFARWMGIEWEMPRYRAPRRLPFIPHEREIDDLIAGCNRYIATFLQVIKETGARAGEVFNLTWIDVDLEGRILRITPEKGSDPRVFRISGKLAKMLESLPRRGERIFSNHNGLGNLACTFQRNRRRVALKLGNPRILKISFHTLRHWRASMEYHRTRDILHVMRVLGHRNIKNTLVYTQLIQPEGDEEYVCRVARSVEQAAELIEAGFEYVCEMEGLRLFRKRK